MKLHILGVSGPFPESGGATSGYLLEAENTLLQFDLGSGTLARLTALAPPESLSALLLSHWSAYIRAYRRRSAARRIFSGLSFF